MALAALARRPADLVCCVGGSRHGARADSELRNGDVVLRIAGALDAEPLMDLYTDLDGTVGDVKAALERWRGIPVREQRLIIEARRICAPEGAGAASNGATARVGNHVPLREALGPDVQPGSSVDLKLIRVAPDWALTQERLQSGASSLAALDLAARSDRELVLTAVGYAGAELAHVAAELRADREVVAAALRNDPLALRFADEVLRDDRALALQAVASNGLALQYASNRVRGDPEVVRVAMSTAWRSLAHASEDLRTDRNFMLDAVRQHGSALCFASAELKNDYDVVFAAVKTSGWALSCASENLRGDRECVFAAVTTNPGALDYASEPLRSDPDLRRVADRGGGRRSTSIPCFVDAAPACPLL